MDIQITFSFEKEVDGVDGYVTHERQDVEDLYELAQFLTDAVRGAGFSYVVNTGFEKDSGEVVFGVI
jgi:isopenicillin N synthase-like dioxygenase